jgi:hypothetical protein
MKVLVIDPKIAGISGRYAHRGSCRPDRSSDPSPVATMLVTFRADNFSFQVKTEAGGLSAKRLTIEVREKSTGITPI